MMSCEDQQELLTQARLLLEDQELEPDDGDEEDGCQYRCLIIADPMDLLRDWSEHSKEEVLGSLAETFTQHGAAVCFISSDHTAPLAHVSVRVNRSRYDPTAPSTQLRREANGPIDGSRSIYSDLFDRAHDNPEDVQAVAATVEDLVVAVEEQHLIEQMEVARLAAEAVENERTAAKVAAAKHLLRVAEVGFAAEIAAAPKVAELGEAGVEEEEELLAAGWQSREELEAEAEAETSGGAE